MTEEIALRLQVLSQLFPTVANSLQPTAPLLQRLSMNEITTYRWSFLEDVINFRASGIDTMGVWRPKLVDYGEERGIELIQDMKMSVSSLSWAGGFTGVNNHSYVDSIDDAYDALQLAGKIKAKSLVLVSGPRAGHTMSHARQLLIEAINELLPLAEKLNVTLAIQPMLPAFAHEWTFLTRLDDALQILDACHHPLVQLAFDVYHLWETPNVMKRIREVATRTAVVQLSDSCFSPNTNYERLLPSDGKIPIAEMMQEFDEAGFRGDFEMNIWSEELWKTDYNQLLMDCKNKYKSLCIHPPAESSSAS